MHLEVVESGCDDIALDVHFDRKNVRLANKWRLFDDQICPLFPQM